MPRENERDKREIHELFQIFVFPPPHSLWSYLFLLQIIVSVWRVTVDGFRIDDRIY
jgi:hypothetical protein